MNYPLAQSALALAASLALAGAALGQSSSGGISGRVLDPSGQAVPGAAITLTKPDTGETRTFTSDTAGDFIFTSLQPGVYDLSVRAQSFKNLENRPSQAKVAALSMPEKVTGLVTAAQFGQLTSARDPRYLQMALRITF